jgi:hypothetical protein
LRYERERWARLKKTIREAGPNKKPAKKKAAKRVKTTPRKIPMYLAIDQHGGKIFDKPMVKSKLETQLARMKFSGWKDLKWTLREA